MPTGFMRNCISVLLFLACAGASESAAAAGVALVGVIGDKAAVLALDGGAPKAVKVGQTWKGITVLRVERERALVEIEGRERSLSRGQYYSKEGSGASDRQSAILAADARGHFVAEGAINGVSLRFLVDTGATEVVRPGFEARRRHSDYRKGERGITQTANGAAAVYRLVLDRVKLGSIELTGVEAEVIESGLTVALLGMSFLNRVQMKRDGRTMTLIRRF
jgi:aspartyl protease family protein